VEFGISAERVRQLFRDNGLRTQSRNEQRALLKDEREKQKRAETGRDDKTPQQPSAWIEKKYTDEELLEILAGDE
jgi:hypothetical protein